MNILYSFALVSFSLVSFEPPQAPNTPITPTLPGSPLEVARRRNIRYESPTPFTLDDEEEKIWDPNDLVDSWFEAKKRQATANSGKNFKRPRPTSNELS